MNKHGIIVKPKVLAFDATERLKNKQDARVMESLLEFALDDIVEQWAIELLAKERETTHKEVPNEHQAK